MQILQIVILLVLCISLCQAFTPSPTRSPCAADLIYSNLPYELVKTEKLSNSVNDVYVKHAEGTLNPDVSATTCYGFKFVNTINDDQSYYFKFYYSTTTVATTGLMKYGEPTFIFTTYTYSTLNVKVCTEKDVCTVTTNYVYPSTGTDRFNNLYTVALSSVGTQTPATYAVKGYMFYSYAYGYASIGFINLGTDKYYQDGLFETFANKTMFLANYGTSNVVTLSPPVNLATQTQLVCQTEVPSSIMCPFNPLKWLAGGVNVTSGYTYFMLNLDGAFLQIYNA